MFLCRKMDRINLYSGFMPWDASSPFAEILVEGELPPFELEASCLLEVPNRQTVDRRPESHPLSTVSKASSPLKVSALRHTAVPTSLTRFAVVFQKAYRASKI